MSVVVVRDGDRVMVVNVVVVVYSGGMALGGRVSDVVSVTVTIPPAFGGGVAPPACCVTVCVDVCVAVGLGALLRVDNRPIDQSGVAFTSEGSPAHRMRVIVVVVYVVSVPIAADHRGSRCSPCERASRAARADGCPGTHVLHDGSCDGVRAAWQRAGAVVLNMPHSSSSSARYA